MAAPKQPDQLDAIRFQQMTLNYVELLYKCRLCQMSPVVLPSAEAFQQHMHAVHFFGAAGAAFCRICELKFHCEADLQAHMTVTHPTGGTEIKRPGTEQVDQPQDLSLRENAVKLENSHADSAWQRGNFSHNPGAPDSHRTTPSPYSNISVKSEFPSEKHTSQPNVMSPKPNLPPSGVIDWFSYRTPGVPEPAKPKNTCSSVKLEDLQRRYGSYASKLVIFDNEFYFCKACHLKFDHDDECEAHFQSEKHRQRVDQQEAKNKQHQDFLKHNTQQIQSASPAVPSRLAPSVPYSPVASPCPPNAGIPSSAVDERSPASEHMVCKSKRKRSLPCRRELSPSNGNNESSDDGGDADTEAGDDIHYHPRYSLMQSDRKRLVTNDGNPAPSEGSLPTTSNTSVPQHIAGTAAGAILSDASKPSISSEPDYPDYPEIDSDAPDSPHSGESGAGKIDGASNGDIQKKVDVLKSHLSRYVTVSSGGSVSRADLLSCMANDVNTKDSPLWGPACNKAMREVFPDSQAQRKGKFKKYFFDVELAPEYRSAVGSEAEIPSAKDNLDAEYSSKDVERIAQALPAVLQWSGAAEANVAQSAVLQVLTERTGDAAFLRMGGECNRAVRDVFPRVAIQQTEKLKQTCYFGVELIPTNHTPAMNNVKMPYPPRTVSTGPPVVNVLHLMEQQRGPMSRLPQSAGPRGGPPMGGAPQYPSIPGLHYPAPNAMMASPYMFMHRSPGIHSSGSPSTQSSQAGSPRHSNSSHSPAMHMSRETSPASFTPTNGSPVSSGLHKEEIPAKRRKTLHELNSQHKGSPSPIPHSPHLNPGGASSNSPQPQNYMAHPNHIPMSQHVHPASAESRMIPTNSLHDTQPSSVSAQNCSGPAVPSSFAYTNSSPSVRLHAADENHAPSATSSQYDKSQNACDPFQQNNNHDLEKLILLNPGAFVTISQFMLRFRRLPPDRVLQAMKMLEQRGLGTLQKGNTPQGPLYILYKPFPVPNLQVALELFGITLREYEAMFRERDPRLEMMDQQPLLQMHPQASIIYANYGH